MEGQFAYGPDHDLTPYQEILERLTHIPLDRAAGEQLAETYRDSYSRALLAQGQFPVSVALRDARDELERTAGLIDSAILLQTLGTLAEGIAIGRGHDEILPADAETVRERLCTRYPDCARMRTEDVASGFTRLANKLRGR